MLGNVNVLPQYNKNILLLLSAVYYRNYTLLRGGVVVAAIGVGGKYLGSMFEHQQLLLGTRTAEHCSIRNSGLMS